MASSLYYGGYGHGGGHGHARSGPPPCAADQLRAMIDTVSPNNRTDAKLYVTPPIYNVLDTRTSVSLWLAR